MRPRENIEKVVRKFHIDVNPKKDQEIFDELQQAQAESRQSESGISTIEKWRIIMKSRRSKLTAAAAILIVGAFGISISEKLTAPAWAIEQTVRALKNIKTITITGTTVYYDSNDVPEYKPFKCWIKLNGKNGNLLMRVESPREIAVVQGDKVYFQRPGSNTVEILEGQSIRNLKFWYKMMELSPWLSGKMLQILRPLADDWQQEYGTHKKTGRDCVFVNCSYEKLSASFWFVFDIESKLIIEARQWSNPNYKEPVNNYADSFIYNERIPDETFQFKIPEGAKVVHQKDVDRDEEVMKRSMVLLDRAEQLFHKEKKYAEAIKIYMQVYEKYSEMNIAEHALMMVGLCHRRLGQLDKEIETYEKTVKEYSHLKGWVEATWFYLGRAYMDQGRNDEALDAFEQCLKAGEAVRKPDQFPLKDARECIDKLKSE